MGFGDWLGVGVTLGAMALGSGVGNVGVAQAQGYTDQSAIIRPSDPMLANSVNGVLSQDEALTRVSIYVTVQNGVVELSGIVANQFEHDRAIADAQSVAGVARVEDNITFQQRDY